MEKMKFRLRLNAQETTDYLSVDEQKALRKVRALLEKELPRVIENVNSALEGFEIGLDDLDMQIGEYWTPYPNHDPEKPSDTGYHVSAGEP